MGKAMRWLRGFLGTKKEKENSNSVPFREKISWRFRKSTRESGIQQATDNSWMMKSYLAEKEEHHAIAVAAATKAAANAAMVAARAAVEVVKLTTQSRGSVWWAAVKIQTFYRGHLARRALRALKGLVKLQAVVRGYFVRKRVAETFQSMQALIQAQARCLVDKQRRLLEEESPKIVEIDTCRSTRWIQTPSISENRDDPCCYYPTSSSSPLRCTGWRFINGEAACRFSTPQPKSRMARSCGDYDGPSTPSSKSVCSGSFLRSSYSNVPKYMTSTESFSAKLRSHSAPRQRADGSCGNVKKRKSFNDRFLAFNNL